MAAKYIVLVSNKVGTDINNYAATPELRDDLIKSCKELADTHTISVYELVSSEQKVISFQSTLPTKL